MFIIILINLKKILISYFSAHFPWHNQILENVFQLIFHDTTKHHKIIHFLEIHFFKKTVFQKQLLFSKQTASVSTSSLPIKINIMRALAHKMGKITIIISAHLSIYFKDKRKKKKIPQTLSDIIIPINFINLKIIYMIDKNII